MRRPRKERQRETHLERREEIESKKEKERESERKRQKRGAPGWSSGLRRVKKSYIERERKRPQVQIYI